MSRLRSNSHNGLGVMNRRFPIWEKGGLYFWHKPMDSATPKNTIVTHRGSRQSLVTEVTALTHRVFIFDPGKQRWMAHLYNGANLPMPTDGDGNYPLNIYDSSNNSQRGLTFDPGLTLLYDAASPTHIVDVSVTSNDLLRIQNTTGGSLRCYQEKTSHATYGTRWQFLCKRTDGGVVDSTVVQPFIWDPGTGMVGPDLGYKVIYLKCRADGWYIVMGCLAPTLGGPNRRYGVVVHNGANVWVDAPVLDRFTYPTFDEPVGSLPITTGATDRSGIVGGGTATGTGYVGTMPESGWLGCCFVPKFDTATNAPYPGTIASVSKGAGNFCKLYISTTFRSLTFYSQVGGVSQAFHEITPLVPGTAYGMVGAWGYRQGVSFHFTCVNGAFQEVGTANLINPMNYGQITFLDDDTMADHFDWGQCFAIGAGDQALQRQDVRALSYWFSKLAIQNYNT